MDLNRIGKLIKKTKDKVIVATDTDLFVVMDLDSYEDLIVNKQAKNKFIAKDALKDSVEIVKEEKLEEIEVGVKSLEQNQTDEPKTPFEEKMKESPVPSSLGTGQAGPISVKDVIAEKVEQTFTAPPAPSSLGTGQAAEDFNQEDEEDEFYFEEIDE